MANCYSRDESHAPLAIKGNTMAAAVRVLAPSDGANMGGLGPNDPSQNAATSGTDGTYRRPEQ